MVGLQLDNPRSSDQKFSKSEIEAVPAGVRTESHVVVESTGTPISSRYIYAIASASGRRWLYP